MALAITSFPVPVSPWIKTAESTDATLSTSVSKARNFGLDPIKSKVVITLLLYECVGAAKVWRRQIRSARQRGGRRLGSGAIRFNARSPLPEFSTGLPAGRA